MDFIIDDFPYKLKDFYLYHRHKENEVEENPKGYSAVVICNERYCCWICGQPPPSGMLTQALLYPVIFLKYSKAWEEYAKDEWSQDCKYYLK